MRSTSERKSSRTDHFRPFVLASLSVLVMCSVVVVGTSAMSMRAAFPVSLKLEDVHTNDRCVVYTYFEDQGMGQAPTVEAWAEIWQAAGWKPVVVSEKHAALHPEYAQMRDRFASYPTVNPGGYELACYLRYLALAAVGGGYMTDYDTINVNVPPPPQCDFLPNDGKLTTHDGFVPAMVSGTEEEFDRVARAMYDVDVNEVMQTTGETMVSDMILLSFFGQEKFCGDHCTVDTATSFYTAPNWVSDPPCDANGDELPMLFHLSSDLMAHTLGTGDKPSAMREWHDRLSEAKQGCNPVSVSTDEEYSQKFLTMPGVNKFTDALKLKWECGHHDCEQSEQKDEAENLLKSAVDKNGEAVEGL